ncbi:peptide ABC transporter permease [Lysinibacillus sphaericus]|uniref:ABC transporter permease n=1 Tax=Lysinibacillus sphaericus TaxID=1421 RepID=UPI0018CE6F2C|nr:ABC transporter permease [Lysinibacillus sphaericus]MBG9453109.1 peptide ABC transporter permease [Lysinibacillus sphaericus]MBG9477598.1 peptide ABC transporter permease [Lysinibacillus sphaericus]MBG9594375.1 peptide ABC transporter permease [Lysinibacillus sphaericus]
MLNMWRISWRNISQNKKRFFISLLGIILGIAFVTSMLIADKTTNDVFDYYEEMYVANADYWVQSDEHTYSEDVVSSVLTSPIVTETMLALDKQAFFELEGDQSLNQRSVRITGVNDQSSSLLKLPVIEGSLDKEGLVIPKAVANLLNKNVGDTIRFTDLGEAKVSAIVEYTQLLASPSNWERAESTSFRIMAPLELLQEWTGMEDKLSYVRFQTTEEGEKLFQSLQEEFRNSNVYVQPVVADDRQSNDIGGLYTFFYLIAGLSMFISGFIVFNMIYTSVMERKKEFAIMKSFGYLQSSVSRLILIEVLLLGLIGTAVGVPMGIWLGDMFMQTLLSVFEFDMVYTLNWKIPALIAVVVGILFPVASSLFPIYNAGKTSVLLTLKMANQTQSSRSLYIVRAVLGVGLLAFVFINHPISYLAILVSIILLFPLLLLGVSRIFKPILKLIFGYSGSLATQTLTKQLNRNANTAAILAVGIAVILLLSAVIESAPEGYENEIRNTYGGDLRVSSEAPWSNQDIEKLLSYDAVVNVDPLTEATPITWVTTDGEKRQFSIFAVDEEGPTLFESSNKDNLYYELAKEPSVILGERAFDEWGGNIGEYIYINTPSGKQQLEVLDVVKTSNYSGYVAFMDENHLNNKFGWTNPFDILLTLNDGYTGEQLRNELWLDFSTHLSKVETVEDKIKSTTSAVTGMNELILIMLVLIIGLASIGTANTLLMNTLERTTEIGTMRALGFTKQQVKKMIIGEGLLIGLSGVIGGIISGVVLLYTTSQSELLGGFISFQLPLGNIILALIAGVSLSLLASWISSTTASKINIISSLKEG